MEPPRPYSDTDPFYSDTHPEGMKVWIGWYRFHLSRELMVRVYQWDPCEHGHPGNGASPRAGGA
jgi:hypothetical protein